MPHHDAPYDVCHVPLHWLNRNQTKLWLLGGELRRRMASALSKRYRSGCGILSETRRLIAFVDPRGGVRELPPPHRYYDAWQAANRPQPRECVCGSFIDPERQAPWRERWVGQDPATCEHHPFCQFDRLSVPVFSYVHQQALARGPHDPRSPQTRPDEWTRARDLIRKG